MRKTYVYWHICVLNNWLEIVREQAERLKMVLSHFDEVRVCVLGDKQVLPLIMELLPGKIILRRHDVDIKKYEAFTLSALLEDSKFEQGFNCLYIHNKGTTQHGKKSEKNVMRWRQMMQFFLLDNCKKCTGLLEYFDTLGCNLLDKGNPFGNTIRFDNEEHSLHYSGNFWWARSDYIKSLPTFPSSINLDENKNYYICERWILQKAPQVRICTLYSETSKHFYNVAPKPSYRKHVGRYEALEGDVNIEVKWEIK